MIEHFKNNKILTLYVTYIFTEYQNLNNRTILMIVTITINKVV